MLRIFLLSLVLLAPPAHAGPRTVILVLEGMNCSTCPLTVRLALKKTAGVIDAKVTLEPPIAVVTYDDAKTTIGQLTRATANAGYPSAPKSQP